MFGTAQMRAVFSDEGLVSRYVEAERALARAQARCGAIPSEAAAAIDDAGRNLVVDFDRLRSETEIVGYPILPLVHQLSKAAGAAGGFVHWGATTQDIMDTANVLQIRAALDLVERDLATLATILAGLAAKHRDTPMAGRTHLQQALPITFGYKAAIWLAGIGRHRERLTQLKPRVLVGQFSGAAGTLASVGAGGLEMQRLFCEELDLGQPAITWHVARDGLAETVALLGLITGSLAKIATDVMLMMATEFGEVSEPFVPGRGASSTMPQKRNPISSELILAAAKAVRQHVATMLDGMIHDFERATGPWHLEWVALPESFLLTASALTNANFMLGGLVVHEKRMRANLDLTGGLIVAEAVMMAAAPKLGRQHAHDVVYGACRQAIEEGGRLADILAGMPEVVAALGSREAIERCCNPANYLGLAGEMVDRVLGATSVATGRAA
ncbi:MULTISPECIES: adenylosuccinate lyase family protein [unclassified Bosea (in: a-proteobacteria)]|uniref:class-II fumarase/aspartase family protein n=1 Tax=unclassified Bosea (in: a-proteobacteria) TaxID=2653178 RepID=UPI000F762F59|nr:MULTISPECIES: adenylosuccinate lyase family protein [unclassified Bosea (in: a-proteobacteria)]AZO81753.1 3-carboxy-cis,cis-muconate cycloisomerase [Bosea sp. Tri-49]RXT26456.1 3-carboxy-cis,cis-muconate cycloisomerase [Bosea sp. Tri-39]RXT33058.1 3-carboxy-cis,cis-muconate cycloisomerase [Bosea sp. Tri-54]